MFGTIREFNATFYDGRKVLFVTTVKAASLSKAAELAEDAYIGETDKTEFSYSKVIICVV